MNNINGLDISLLGFLSLEPMHGYELHRQVSDLSGFGIVWNIKIGKLYAMLNRLEKAGYIKSIFSKEGNRPTRNEFSITTLGKKKYTSWLSTPVNRGREFRIIFLLKLFFSMKIGIESANNLITNQIETCNSWLTERKLEIEEIIEKRTEIEFASIVKMYRQIQIEGYLSWLDWCRESLLERTN